VNDFDSLDAPRRELAPLLRQLDAEGPPTPSCLGEDAIAALAEGSGGRELRDSAVPHLAACPRCRRAVAAVSRLLADPELQGVAPTPPSHRPQWKRWATVALPLAAAAVLLLLIGPEGRTPEAGPRHRGATAPVVPMATSPRGMVADARLLRWAAVPEATQYRVTVFDAESRVVYTGEAVDTILALPDSVVLWAASAPTEFVIAPDGAQ